MGDVSNDRERFKAAEGKAKLLPFALVRETLFGQPGIADLYRDFDTNLPMIRTVWTQTFADDRSRDRTFDWMFGRLDRWTAWGERARGYGAAALTEHLLSLIVLDDGLADDSDDGAPARLAITPTSPDRCSRVDVSRRIHPTRRCGGTRHDWPVPIASGRSTWPCLSAGEIELPVVLVSALVTLGVTIPTFLDCLRSAATVQDVVFMHPDAEVSVEAHLGSDGLSCAIRLARMCWYHHPGDEIHATASAAMGVTIFSAPRSNDAAPVRLHHEISAGSRPTSSVPRARQA